MIAGWVLVYFIVMGTDGGSPALAPAPNQGLNKQAVYTSQTECQMHADQVNKASGAHIRAECQALAE